MTRRWGTLIALAAVGSLLGGCAVVTVAGAAASAAISVTGEVIGTTVRVTGKVAGKVIDAVTPSSEAAPAK